MNTAPLPRTPDRRFQLGICLALLAAFALMLRAASGDLWMDEIWSILLAGLLKQGVDPLLILRHDNNHTLNTLYQLYLGGSGGPLQHRLLSVLSGIACLALLARTAWSQWGPRAALLVVTLAALSFPMLLYATEARGYSMLMLLAVTAYVAWRRHLQTSGVPSLIIFWVASILGLLAHATFVVAMLAFGLGQLGTEDPGTPAAKRVLPLLRVQFVPLVFSLFWYWFVLSRLVIGGGEPIAAWTIIGETCTYLLGLPDTALLRVVAMVGTAAVATLGVLRLRASGDRQWGFFATMLLLGPALLCLASRGLILQVRYFAVAFPFFLLLAAALAATSWVGLARGMRALLLLAFAVFLAGNLQRDYFLLKFGRGQYSRALEYVLQQSPPGPVWIGSDHDNRNSMVIQFHAGRLAGGQRIRYVDDAHAADYKPDWYFLHNFDVGANAPRLIQVDQVGQFQLERVYPHAGLSGWTWFLYRRVR